MTKRPAVQQDEASWRAGYKAGLSGMPSPEPPPGVDRLAYVSGVIEGQAARAQDVVRLPVRHQEPQP